MSAKMTMETDSKTKATEYETLREKLLQERDELGDEWLIEEFGMPPPAPAAPVGQQWVRNPPELVSVIQFFTDQ